MIAFDRAIGAEDKLMLERVPGVLPLDQQGTVSVQADRPSVEWRRRLSTALSERCHRGRLIVRICTVGTAAPCLDRMPHASGSRVR